VTYCFLTGWLDYWLLVVRGLEVLVAPPSEAHAVVEDHLAVGSELKAG